MQKGSIAWAVFVFLALSGFAEPTSAQTTIDPIMPQLGAQTIINNNLQQRLLQDQNRSSAQPGGLPRNTSPRAPSSVGSTAKFVRLPAITQRVTERFIEANSITDPNRRVAFATYLQPGGLFERRMAALGFDPHSLSDVAATYYLAMWEIANDGVVSRDHSLAVRQHFRADFAATRRCASSTMPAGSKPPTPLPCASGCESATTTGSSSVATSSRWRSIAKMSIATCREKASISSAWL